MKHAIILLLLSGTVSLSAQTPVENFSLLNVVQGATTSLEFCPTCRATAVLFTSNECPYDQYYVERIKTLANAYQGKIQFLLVNSYLEAEETEDKMKTSSGKWGLSLPYLADKEQVAMTSLGARKSPEVFLVTKEGGKFVVSYSGAIDDNPQVATAVTQQYLKSAIDKLLAGSKIDAAMVRAVGCTIRKK